MYLFCCGCVSFVFLFLLRLYVGCRASQVVLLVSVSVWAVSSLCFVSAEGLGSGALAD